MRCDGEDGELTACIVFFSSRRRHTILQGDWSSDVCSSDLGSPFVGALRAAIASAFPGHARAIIGGALAVAIATALLTALARIRDRRALRYLALGTDRKSVV